MKNTFKILTIALFIISCTPAKKEVDISGVELSMHINRFEEDLISASKNSSFDQLDEKYPAFFEIFIRNRIGLTQDSGSMMEYYLNSYLNDRYVKEVTDSVESTFPDLSDLEEEFTGAFRYYTHYFPGRTIPMLVSYVSGSYYAILVDDSLLAFGLDKYLGSDCSIYPKMGIPKYQSQRMSKEYLVADCMIGWISTEFEDSPGDVNLLSQIIYHGKLLYALDLLLPGADDHIKVGYTREQIQWCRDNEAEVWAHFIERELLFKQDNSVFTKYMAEGPFTPGFPEGSPGQIGRWVGWQIVRKYMKNNPSVSLQQLLAGKTDANKILNESSYKPNK